MAHLRDTLVSGRADLRSDERHIYDKMVPDRKDRKCTGLKTDGQPCTRWAVRGGNVCATHGGSEPATRAAARRRLLEFVEPALVTLRDKLDSDDDMAAIKAATAILDRAGFGVHASLTVNDKREDLSTLTDEQLAQRVVDISHQLKESNTQQVLEGETITPESTTTH